MRKSLTINAIDVFRVGVFTTLKTVKYLSLSNLQVAFRPSIKGSDMATMLPQRGLTALVLFFHWDSVPAPDAPHGLCVLHVFAAATGWTKSNLLPTSLDSRVQIRTFCTRRPSHCSSLVTTLSQVDGLRCIAAAGDIIGNVDLSCLSEEELEAYGSSIGVSPIQTCTGTMPPHSLRIPLGEKSARIVREGRFL